MGGHYTILFILYMFKILCNEKKKNKTNWLTAVFSSAIQSVSENKNKNKI